MAIPAKGWALIGVPDLEAADEAVRRHRWGFLNDIRRGARTRRDGFSDKSDPDVVTKVRGRR